MWPYLMGAGWLWDMLLSAGIIAGIIVAGLVLLAPGRQPGGYAEAAQDRIQTVWHAYEQGDLTEWEFARLITPRPMRPRHTSTHAGATAGTVPGDSADGIAAG